MTEILLLTQHDCGFCDHARQVLARVGVDHELTVTEVDLNTEHGQRLAAETRMLFAPGVLVDGEPFSFGRLSERKLRARLTRAGSTK